MILRLSMLIMLFTFCKSHSDRSPSISLPDEKKDVIMNLDRYKNFNFFSLSISEPCFEKCKYPFLTHKDIEGGKQLKFYLSDNENYSYDFVKKDSLYFFHKRIVDTDEREYDYYQYHLGSKVIGLEYEVEEKDVYVLNKFSLFENNELIEYTFLERIVITDITNLYKDISNKITQMKIHSLSKSTFSIENNRWLENQYIEYFDETKSKSQIKKVFDNYTVNQDLNWILMFHTRFKVEEIHHY